MQSQKALQWILITGAIFAMGAVIIGAFGAHGLKQVLDSYALGLIDTAAKYQMYHAIALLVVGVMSAIPDFSTLWLKRSASAFTLGIILFSGSLYLLAFTHVKWLGAITPIGGSAFISGWLMLIMSIRKGDVSTER
ncbi:MAG: uncharacterized membrane protein YgdD (TMEM256/DUF423 family) [Urechidicola sp.]|jgi:uncharacterized membrane protein YgdD (TMEM256/DUF423 family)